MISAGHQNLPAIIWRGGVRQTKRVSIGSREIKARRVATRNRDLINDDFASCRGEVLCIRKRAGQELSFFRRETHRPRAEVRRKSTDSQAAIGLSAREVR